MSIAPYAATHPTSILGASRRRRPSFLWLALVPVHPAQDSSHRPLLSRWNRMVCFALRHTRAGIHRPRPIACRVRLPRGVARYSVTATCCYAISCDADPSSLSSLATIPGNLGRMVSRGFERHRAQFATAVTPRWYPRGPELNHARALQRIPRSDEVPANWRCFGGKVGG